MDVKQFLANARQGTHKSKERGEINRTTKKHHKQKGTGGARAVLAFSYPCGGGTVSVHVLVLRLQVEQEGEAIGRSAFQ